MISAPIKYPGAKWSYANWICSFIPPHRMYLEPYFGSGAVFFRKYPATYETINDLDGQVVNFFRVCRDYPEELSRLLALTPFSRQEYLSIQEETASKEIKLSDNPVENARRFAVRCSQGFGNKLADRVGWKNTKHSAGPVNPLIWNRAPEIVIEVAQRLKNAQIECTEAVELIRNCNAGDCLIYADPPYLGNTRHGRIYRHEMQGEKEHEVLLEALLSHKGPVILSGYDNDLYNERLSNWSKVQMEGRASSAAVRSETLWMNFDYQMTL